MAFSRSPRPDIRKDRLGYEKSWEEDFERNYVKGRLASLSSLAVITAPAAVSKLATDTMLVQLAHEARLICNMQNDLAQEAVEKFAQEDFEKHWLGLPDEKRREFILEGICRSMVVGDMEDRRRWCPDSTLNNLASDGGSTYIKMLKTLLPADMGKPITEPRRIPHPLMDRLLSLPPNYTEQAPGYKTLMQVHAYSRTYCLTFILWNTFLAFVSEQIFVSCSRRTVLNDLYVGRQARESVPNEAPAFRR